MKTTLETILVVSPDSHHIKVTRECLEKAGYLVLAASLGQEGLEMASTQRPDLVVVDWKLPDLSGLGFTRLIRSSEKISGLPLILTGGNIKEEDLMIALEAGADLCLKEPFHPSVFVARVRALLRRCHNYAFA